MVVKGLEPEDTDEEEKEELAPLTLELSSPSILIFPQSA